MNKNTSKKNSKVAKKVNKTNQSNKSNLDQMKYEIASEFGVTLGPNSTSKDCGRVGGEITKRLVEKSMNKKSKKSC